MPLKRKRLSQRKENTCNIMTSSHASLLKFFIFYFIFIFYIQSAYHLHGIFRWDFWDKWNSLFLPVKMGQNNPVELGRLGRLVPRFTKSSTVGEKMAQVRFCKWYSLSWSFRLKRKKRNTFEGIPSILEFSLGLTIPFDISSPPKKEKMVFRYKW